MKHNRYDESFKLEAVKLALSGEHTYAQIARDLGVNYQTLCHWIRQTMDNSKHLTITHQTRLSSLRTSEPSPTKRIRPS